MLVCVYVCVNKIALHTQLWRNSFILHFESSTHFRLCLPKTISLQALKAMEPHMWVGAAANGDLMTEKCLDLRGQNEVDVFFKTS